MCSKARCRWGEFDSDFLCVCVLKAGQELACSAGLRLCLPVLPRVTKKEEAALEMELLVLSKGIYTTGLCRLKNCISTVLLLTVLHKLPEMLCLLHFWIFKLIFTVGAML